MKPYVWPSSDETPPVSARRTFPCQFQANHGTLNIFSPANQEAPEEMCGAVGAHHPTTISVTGHRGLRHYHNHNRESTATLEFPLNGLRHVAVPEHAETPQGIRHVRGAAGAQRNVQVVSITEAYKDPLQMGPPRTGVRCLRPMGGSSKAGAVLSFAQSEQPLSARVLAAPVGKPATKALYSVDYSVKERFAQAVRDHAQQRARGVAEFYVQLVRNAVGGTTSSTPSPVVVPWTLDAKPVTRVLTLQRCRDQLVSLTAISVSLQEFAELLWGHDEEAAASTAAPAEEAHLDHHQDNGDRLTPLEDRPVLFRDFAAAFGQNTDDGRLARMKI